MARFKTQQAAPALVAVGVLIFVCILLVLRPDALEHLELKTFDWRVRLARNFNPPVATNLGFVFISDASIATLNNGTLGFRYGLYWPRHIYGRLVQELAAQGATAIAIDILFGELRPDHAPVQVDPALEPELEEWLRQLHHENQPVRIENMLLVESDDLFAWQMRRASNVVLAAAPAFLPHPLFATNALCLGNVSTEPDSDGVLRRVKVFEDVRLWHPLFKLVEADPSYGIDLRKAHVDPDKIVLPRDGLPEIIVPLDSNGNFQIADFIGDKLPPGWSATAKPFTTQRIWQFGIAMAALELGLDLANAQIDRVRKQIVLHGPNGLQRVIPIDGNDCFYINWNLTPADPRISSEPVEELLRKHLARMSNRTSPTPETWRGKLVVIGSIATGSDLTDRGATPLEKEALLVGAHLNVANSVLTGRFIRRASLRIELLLTCLLGICTSLGSWRFKASWATVSAVLIASMYVFVCAWLFVKSRYWLPVVMPLVGGVLLEHLALVTYRVVFAEKERRRIRSIFAKLVSPDVVQELLSSPSLSLGGASREVTVMFADLRDFTQLTDNSRTMAAELVRKEALSGPAAEACFQHYARDVLATVNLYLSLVAEMVKSHGGTLDKYIGDCVMAFWGAPNPDPAHALHAVQAAVAIQRAVATLNRRRIAENALLHEQQALRTQKGEPQIKLVPILSFGIGVNSGVVTVGLMGSEAHILNYTVFGRDVNLASRLENLSAGGQISIGESTYLHIARLDPELAAKFVPMPPAIIKGFRDPVRFYRLSVD